jgi:hypothetical protein
MHTRKLPPPLLRMRAPSWLRMPGSFRDPSLEAAWLADSSAQRLHQDARAYAVSALIHAVESWRMPAASRAHSALRVAYVRAHPCALRHSASAHAPLLLIAAHAADTRPARPPAPACQCCALLLLLPLAPPRARALYASSREPHIAGVRLVAAAAARLWSTGANPLSGGWMGRLPLLSLAVRWPLHALLTALSFLLSLPSGADALVGMRVALALLNVAVIMSFERASREHFTSARARAKAAGGKGG